MKILFIIAALSFAALVWAALAILRHVRKNSARAASQSGTDSELSEALGLRLSELSRQPVHAGVPAASSGTPQDFSYFNRDAAPALADNKSYSETQPPIRAVVADRPSHS